MQQQPKNRNVPLGSPSKSGAKLPDVPKIIPTYTYPPVVKKRKK